MSDLIKNHEDALKFLKVNKNIVVPPEYTYLVHNTSYKPDYGMGEDDIKKRSWSKIPNKEFVIKQEMSFVERLERMRAALAHGSLDRASVDYANPTDALPFQIRVIYPSRQLTKEQQVLMNISDERYKEIKYCHLGLGDGRHAKLKKDEKIHIFACTQMDEASRKKIDIVYGVCDKDIVAYSNMVKNWTEQNKDAAIEEDIPQSIDDTRNQRKTTLVLNKDKDLSRIQAFDLCDKQGNICLVGLPPYHNDYKTLILSQESLTQ